MVGDKPEDYISLQTGAPRPINPIASALGLHTRGSILRINFTGNSARFKIQTRPRLVVIHVFAAVQKTRLKEYITRSPLSSSAISLIYHRQSSYCGSLSRQILPSFHPPPITETMPPTLPTTLGSNGLLIPLEPLTPSTFSPFGTAITSPLPDARRMTKPPASATQIPRPLHDPYQPAATLANQNSALKTSPISIFQNSYPQTPSSPSWPQMSMFSCFPRNLSGIGMEVQGAGQAARGGGTSVGASSREFFRVSILERHPYTTQTFLPLGLADAEVDAGNSHDDDDDGNDTVFLVIVAPSLASSHPRPPPPVVAQQSSLSPPVDPLVLPQSTPHNPPDISRIRAFVACGNQAVTYAPGTWHAPMVVLGSRRVDFVVTQFVNGVADDDCQEVLLGGNQIRVDVSGLLSKPSSSTDNDSPDQQQQHQDQGLWSMGRRSRSKGRLNNARARL